VVPESNDELLDGGAAPSQDDLAALPEASVPEVFDGGAAPRPGAAAQVADEIEAEDAGSAPSVPE
jgi:hypothetical protein